METGRLTVSSILFILFVWALSLATATEETQFFRFPAIPIQEKDELAPPPVRTDNVASPYSNSKEYIFPEENPEQNQEDQKLKLKRFPTNDNKDYDQFVRFRAEKLKQRAHSEAARKFALQQAVQRGVEQSAKIAQSRAQIVALKQVREIAQAQKATKSLLEKDFRKQLEKETNAARNELKTWEAKRDAVLLERAHQRRKRHKDVMIEGSSNLKTNELVDLYRQSNDNAPPPDMPQSLGNPFDFQEMAPPPPPPSLYDTSVYDTTTLGLPDQGMRFRQMPSSRGPIPIVRGSVDEARDWHLQRQMQRQTMQEPSLPFLPPPPLVDD